MRAPALCALACVSLAVGLSACGDISSSSTSATTTQSTATTGPRSATTLKGKPGASTSAPTKGPRKPSAEVSATGPNRGSSSGASAKKGAAAFVISGGDNSIPNYGSAASSSERDEATAALSAYLEARAKGDWASACSYLGAAVKAQVALLAKASTGKQEGCVGDYAALSEQVPPSEHANPFSGSLAALRVDGEKAFALFYGLQQQQYMMPMVSEGGGWKMGIIQPVPYPPGAPSGGG